MKEFQHNRNHHLISNSITPHFLLFKFLFFLQNSLKFRIHRPSSLHLFIF